MEIRLTMIATSATFSRTMAKKKAQDRHKPRVIVGIPTQLAEAFQPLADRRMRSLSKQIVDVLLEYAEKHGMLNDRKPPKPNE